MSAWTRSPSCGRLIRVAHACAIPTIALNPEEMAEEQAQGPPQPPPPAPRSLNQIFYHRDQLIALVFKFHNSVGMFNSPSVLNT